MYGVEVSPTHVSQVTQAIHEEVYPIVYLDANRVKVRQGGMVLNKAVYLTVGVTIEGIKSLACELPRLKEPSSGCR